MNSTHSTGDSAFAAAVKTGRWANPEVLERLAEAHQQQRAELWEAANRSLDHYRPRLAEALAGEAGEAMLKAHDENAKLWFRHADTYATSGRALVNALGELQGLNIDLDLLIQEKEPAYNAALKRGNIAGAEDILTSSLAEADDMVTDRGTRATQFVQAVDFTMPLPERPTSGEQNKGPDHDKQTEKPQKPTKASDSDGTKATSDEATPTALKHDKQSDVPTASESGPNSPVSSALSGHDKETAPSEPASTLPATSMMSRGGSSAGGGSGSGGGVGSGMSGLGSSMRPPGALGSPGGSGMSGSGAMPGSGSMPGGASTSPAAASPLGSTGSSFQNGLASGMSATGGGSAAPVSPVSQSLSQQQAAAAYAAQSPASAVPQVGSTPAGAPIGGSPAGADLGGGPAQGGSSSGAPMGGGAMMPPTGAMSGGPLAPYSAPGAGPGGATPAAPSAATSPASGGTSSSGGSPAGPLMAAGHASGGAASGLASSAASEVNPDLLLAQRVLGGLVRACENWPSLIVWAVSVVKTPVGSQIIIATGSGGGGYVPPTVVLPTTARLAVVDPVLPFGWAAPWMGCQRPSNILADHFELFRKKTAGAQLSAMVTTEAFAQAPEGVQDFLGLQHRDALTLVSEAPRLDGGHQHRLAALDPGLAHRVTNFEKIGADVVVRAAANVTAAVINAAHAEPDVSGDKLVTTDETAVLQSVYRGTADDVGWALYDSQVRQRHNGVLEWPETHAPQDFDGSKLNHDMARLYRKYFRMSQIVELVRCWKFSPPPLADVVYCGIHAGFGSAVVAEIGALEQQLRGNGGGHS